jgi:hypothetical protein
MDILCFLFLVNVLYLLNQFEWIRVSAGTIVFALGNRPHARFHQRPSAGAAAAATPPREASSAAARAAAAAIVADVSSPR